MLLQHLSNVSPLLGVKPLELHLHLVQVSAINPLENLGLEGGTARVKDLLSYLEPLTVNLGMLVKLGAKKLSVCPK